MLRALRLLGDHPSGLSSAQLGAELGKSPATARYMINTLCDAGYAERDTGGRCRLTDAPPWGSWVPEEVHVAEPAATAHGDPDPGAILAEAVTDLYRRTRQRSYLVRRTAGVAAAVEDMRGHQGLARLPGLATVIGPDQAHALAMTQVLLAVSPGYREAVTAEPLPALTDRTITCPDMLRAELTSVARRGWAVDDGGFADGFATIAASVTSPTGGSTVALGLSCSTRRLAAEAEELVAAVVAVAAAAQQEWARGFTPSRLGSPAEAPAPVPVPIGTAPNERLRVRRTGVRHHRSHSARARGA